MTTLAALTATGLLLIPAWRGRHHAAHAIQARWRAGNVFPEFVGADEDGLRLPKTTTVRRRAKRRRAVA